MAFDGANIWVANPLLNTVTKLRASDGAALGTFPAGPFPYGVAFDGANIWVVNREAIEVRGAKLLYLPPYSPALSPIECCWSKLKTALRARGARTRRTLEDALKQALTTITKADAVAWFTHCGYTVN